MDANQVINQVLIFAIPAVLAITLHEAAHGYVAKHFGDSTAYMLGRVTLNPIKHIDPLGTIVVPLVTAFTGFIFGWAKPVPVNFRNLNHPKRDMLWVAAAGPGSNLAQAAIWALVAKVLLLSVPESTVRDFWFAVCEAGIFVNVMIGIVNLVPVLPLDGGRIVASLLPDRLSYAYSRLEPYGLIILVLLLVSKVLNWFLWPLITFTANGIFAAFGLK